MDQVTNIYLKLIIKIGCDISTHQSICFQIEFYLLVLNAADGIFHVFLLVADVPVIDKESINCQEEITNRLVWNVWSFPKFKDKVTSSPHTVLCDPKQLPLILPAAPGVVYRLLCGWTGPVGMAAELAVFTHH